MKFAEVALVEVEEIGARGGRLEQGDRLAPVVARRPSERKIVAAGEPREIAGRDQAAPGDIFEVAGELRPERRLKRDVLADAEDAEISE